MKVPGAPSAVPDDDRAAADQLFTEIYAEHRVRLIRYLAMFLSKAEYALAEDLAQDAFIRLWRELTDRPGNTERQMVYGLLKLMGRRAIGSYFKTGRSHELAVDYDTPDGGQLAATGSSYAPDVPGLHGLALELDAAMERMRRASALWRGLNIDAVNCRIKLSGEWRDSNGGLSERTRTELEQKAAQTEAAEERALVDFRESCRRVGELRADLEREAGPNWRSSTGMPHRINSGGSTLTSASDPSATHCPKAHLMDRLNTGYTEQGVRRCRACSRIHQSKRVRPSAPGRRNNKTTDPEVIEQARQLLADPALGHNIRTVAEQLGVGQMTLYRAFPGGVNAIRTAAVPAGAGR